MVFLVFWIEFLCKKLKFNSQSFFAALTHSARAEKQILLISEDASFLHIRNKKEKSG